MHPLRNKFKVRFKHATIAELPLIQRRVGKGKSLFQMHLFRSSIGVLRTETTADAISANLYACAVCFPRAYSSSFRRFQLLLFVFLGRLRV